MAKYKVGNKFFDGSATLSEIFDGVESEQAIVASTVKDNGNFYESLQKSGKYASDSIVDFIRQLYKRDGGTDKILAIKLTRCATGWSLQEAKEFVESL